MTPERWQQVERVYHAVVAWPEAEREPLLVALCAADEDLRREVESLLAEAGASEFLGTPAVIRIDVAAQQSLVGHRVGPYVVAGPLGSGGMGEVYRARDQELGRDVALKILPDAFRNGPERRARLEREARVLAGRPESSAHRCHLRSPRHPAGTRVGRLPGPRTGARIGRRSNARRSRRAWATADR